MSDADIVVMMTQDAVPADPFLLEKLSEVLNEHPDAVAAYARQIPDQNCGLLEKYTRVFNYPPKSQIKSQKDLPKLGIKTYFCSNVCAAYKKSIYEEIGGFVKKAIFNEDMIYAATAMDAGYAVAYVPEAKVVHSHNLTPMQQFHRNFDLAVSQAEHPEIFAELKSEGEGIRLVKQTAKYLLAHFRGFLIPELMVSSGCKYLGYKLGKQYEKLPRKMILWCSMSPLYWEKKWRRKS